MNGVVGVSVILEFDESISVLESDLAKPAVALKFVKNRLDRRSGVAGFSRFSHLEELLHVLVPAVVGNVAQIDSLFARHFDLKLDQVQKLG